MAFAGVPIIFLPHCIAILSILPWERLTRQKTAVDQSWASSSSAAR